MTGRLPRLHGHRVQLCPARTTYTKMIEYRIPYRAVAGAVPVARVAVGWLYRIYVSVSGIRETRYHFTFYTVP